MPKKVVGTTNRGGHSNIITRAEILRAQQNSVSAASAARFLGVGIRKYKKYATIYNLYESHLNPRGIGTSKGYAARPSTIPLKDIFANKYPKYSLNKLKNRMIARNLLREECHLCGFKERRLTDHKSPLLISFKSGTKDFAKDNIQLLCYNCMFLTTGAPAVAYKGYIEKSFTQPERIPERWDVAPRAADAVDVGETDEEPHEEFLNIRDEVLKELGRE